MGFLSEAIADSSRVKLSSLAECMVLATIYGRCMTHRRLALTSILSGNNSREFWKRHESLAAAMEKWIQFHQQDLPASPAIFECDTIRVYTHMLANSIIVYLSQITETVPWQAVEHQLMAITYEQRAYKAATEMVDLAKVVARVSCFKASNPTLQKLTGATTCQIEP